MARPDIEWIENFYKQDDVWESSATIVELCGYIKELEGKPLGYNLTERCPCTEDETGARCALVQGHAGECDFR